MDQQPVSHEPRGILEINRSKQVKQNSSFDRLSQDNQSHTCLNSFSFDEVWQGRTMLVFNLPLGVQLCVCVLV